MRTFTIVSLIFASLAGCTHTGAESELSKDELRSAAANGKADDVYDGDDFCEEFGWYGDMECDDFCPAPDPDCAACRLPGETCPDTECGPAPSHSPRLCPDGSFIYGSSSCIDTGGTCNWAFDAPECPQLDEGALCDEALCGGPRPALSARPCHDGTFVFGSVDCRADVMGACDWTIGNTECPACDASECGPEPLLSPRRCPDGTLLHGSATCADTGLSCDWEIDAMQCPVMVPGTACDESQCGDAPDFSPRVCCDGTTVAPEASCEADAMGTACEWVVGTAVCG